MMDNRIIKTTGKHITNSSGIWTVNEDDIIVMPKLFAKLIINDSII